MCGTSGLGAYCEACQTRRDREADQIIAVLNDTGMDGDLSNSLEALDDGCMTPVQFFNSISERLQTDTLHSTSSELIALFRAAASPVHECDTKRGTQVILCLRF
jgi:hypothetical protein